MAKSVGTFTEAARRILLRASRKLNAGATSVALMAEDVERTLHAVGKAAGKRPAGDGDPPIVFDALASARAAKVLATEARRSPIDSLVWLESAGRRSRIAINAVALELPGRLDRILRILDAQPAADDGFAGAVTYEALRKQLSVQEGRKIRAHSLSQSLTLLAAELEAHGLNRYWLDRAPKSRRVRLLIRRRHAVSG